MAEAFNLNYKASPTFASVHQDDDFVRGIRGPVGSGKSVGCIMDIIMRALRQAPNRNNFRKTRWAIVRATYPELKSTTIRTFQDWLPDHMAPLKINEAPITAKWHMPLPDGTVVQAEFLFIALDKPKDLAKLLSLEITGAFVNESKELPKEVIDTITSRIGRYPAMRDGGPSWAGMIMDTNSPSTTHWWKELEEDPPRGWKFYRQPPAMTKDKDGNYHVNPSAENLANLPPDYYPNAITGKPTSWIRAYVLNQFAATQVGRPVYEDLWNEQVHIAPALLVPFPDEPVIVGLDFGLTPAAVFTQMRDGQCRVIDEVVADRMGLEQFLTLDLMPLIGQKYFSNDVTFVGDPAGTRGADTDAKSCFDVMVRFGLPAVPAHSNALEPRLGSVREFLTSMAPGGKPGLLVSPACRVLINGFNGEYSYARMQVSGEERYREVPDKNHASHPHDALQYACMRHQILSKRRSHVMTPSDRPWQAADMMTGY